MSFHSLNLEELRGQEPLAPRKTPFEHQLDAFDALNRTFAFADGAGVGALLVLPTGGGKTFTTVKWLCDQAVRRNHKILWLAHSFYLLNQAFHEFERYARWIPEPRQILNIRVVSSNPSHDSASSIALTDDVVIMTTQTAIKNLHVRTTDESGQNVASNFRRFIESGEQSGLLVVLDEAHHAPAYGCRHLLIGRALRGKKAGGGDEANIVLFMDEWKRLIDWATPAMLDGGLGGERVVRGHFPLEYISIRLIEELARRINSGGEYVGPPFSRIVPIGWYQTEFVVAVEDGSEETRPVVEYVMVYDDTKPKFDAFIKHFHQQMPRGWDNEALSQDWIQTAAEPWMTCFFDGGDDAIGNSLLADLARIARHIAQRQAVPEYHSFDDRAAYDLDALADRRLTKSSLENDEFLRGEFGKPGTLWRVFYKNYDRFTMAFDGAVRRRIHEQRFGKMESLPDTPPAQKRRRRELSEAEKRQVLRRDGNACLCCGASGRGVRLQVDPIISYSLGGDSTIENSQTLCSVCNRETKLNELNFRQTATPLPAPCELELLARSYNADLAQALTRLVNYFYRCRAVAQVHLHTRSSGRFYETWEVELFGGNDPRWLKQHEPALLAHVQDDFGCAHVKRIKIRGAE